MSRRDRGRRPRRWPWLGLILAAAATWAGFLWTNRLLYPGPGRPPGETLRFAEPRESARPDDRRIDEPPRDDAPGREPRAPAAGGPASAPPVAEPPARVETPAEVRGREPTGSSAAVGVEAPTARTTTAPRVSPTPAGSPRPRPTASIAIGGRAGRPASRPRESFDDIDRRTLEAILERRERERRAQKAHP